MSDCVVLHTQGMMMSMRWMHLNARESETQWKFLTFALVPLSALLLTSDLKADLSSSLLAMSRQKFWLCGYFLPPGYV
jgi:hypothetical protein